MFVIAGFRWVLGDSVHCTSLFTSHCCITSSAIPSASIKATYMPHCGLEHIVSSSWHLSQLWVLASTAIQCYTMQYNAKSFLINVRSCTHVYKQTELARGQFFAISVVNSFIRPVTSFTIEWPVQPPGTYSIPWSKPHIQSRSNVYIQNISATIIPVCILCSYCSIWYLHLEVISN